MMNRDEIQLIRGLWGEYFEVEGEIGGNGEMNDACLSFIKDLDDLLSCQASYDTCLVTIDELVCGSTSATLNLWLMTEISRRQPNHAIDLMAHLEADPEALLGSLGLAICLILARMPQTKNLSSQGLRKISVRLDTSGALDFTPIRDLRSIHVGRYVRVQGQVARASSIAPLILSSQFSCPKCGSTMDHRLKDGKFSQPRRCVNATCKARNFNLIRETAVTVDSQYLKLREAEVGCKDPGSIPRSVEVELTGDLVDQCIPGDLVTVSGVVKSMNAELAQGRTSKTAKASGLYLLYIKGNHILNSRRATAVGGVSTATDDDEEFSETDIEAITEIANLPDPFSMLVASVCPHIYGHELVKAGLLLALLGGTAKVETNSAITVRNDIHVLMAGDPGTGKTQLLHAIHALSPRSVYIGSNTTKTGLTVTVVKDGNDVGLEAGALVLADQGVCCIDEFDKMKCDHMALYEAMEQQQVSIAKSGVVATLSARCSIIAAANPVGGHYHRGKSVSDNLRMSNPLLSRFDLIFIVLDCPDTEHDRMLSRHILHQMQTNSSNTEGLEGRNRLAGGGGDVGIDEEQQTLQQSLRYGMKINPPDPIPVNTLRKYIAYARVHCNPRLTVGAARILQRLYVDLRSDSAGEGSMPITVRQLESLIRLSEARARASLRDEVSASDAIAVVKLMEESMKNACSDEFGVIDFGGGGGGQRKRKVGMARKVKAFMHLVCSEVQRKNSNLITEPELRALASKLENIDKNMCITEWPSFLELLRSECYLLLKGSRLYQVNKCPKRVTLPNYSLRCRQVPLDDLGETMLSRGGFVCSIFRGGGRRTV